MCSLFSGGMRVVGVMVGVVVVGRIESDGRDMGECMPEGGPRMGEWGALRVIPSMR